MQYTVLEASSLATLITEVNKYLDWGWRLQGGVCRDRYWYQAMAKPAQPTTSTTLLEGEK